MKTSVIQRLVSSFVLVGAFCSTYFACSATTKDPGNTTINTDINISAGGAYGKPCIESASVAVVAARPVDVVFVIDNSGSMVEELAAIKDNINQHFAAIMDAAGLDYRVIMLVRHGSNVDWGFVCFEAPLSSIPKGGCAGIDDNPPGNQPGKFYHYSYEVGSNNSPCLILETLVNSNDRVDDFGLAPDGWMSWLRPSAFKIIIEVTDDAPACWWYPDPNDLKKKKILNDFQSSLGGQIFAVEFDKLLTKLAPEQFGTPENRNYVFYSVVGMMEKPDAIDEDFGALIDPLGKPEDPFLPDEDVVSNACSSAITPGQGYQSLSKLTGGLRFPVCQAEKFDIVFEKIAKSIDSVVSTVCSLEIPLSSEGPVNVETIEVTVETLGGEQLKLIPVLNSSMCSGTVDEYYVDSVSSNAFLCPATCNNIKAVIKSINLTAGCEPLLK